MADSFIQLSPDSTGKKVDTRTAPDGDHREVQVIGSPTTADVAEADAANGLDVDVTRLPALAAGTNNIGDVDVLTVPAPLSTTGGGTEASALRVTLASDSTGLVSVDDNGGSLTVDGTVAVTGVATAANQATEIASLATIAGDTTDIEAAVELIDDTVATLGTDLYTEATTKGLIVGAVRRDADTTLVNTTNEISPLQVDANGRLKVEAFSGETLPVSLTSTTITGAVDTELPAAAALADNTATPTAPAVGAFLMGFDGTNWDRLQTGAATGGALKVDGSAVTQPVSAASLPLPSGAATLAGQTQPGVDIGDVTVNNASGASAVNVQDGGNSLTVDNAALSVVGGGTEATALRVTVANDSTGVVSVDDNGGALTVDGTVTANQGTAGTAWEMVGDVASDAAVPTNPVIIGGRASTAQPTAVSADGDSVNMWMNRKGSPIVSTAPHVGYLSDPWVLTGETAQYTTTQTSAVLVAGGASERLVVTKVQIQVGGTTAGTLQLYFGTGAYARGTNLAIFDGEFAPSATLKPGVVMDGPFISATNGDDLLVTTSAAINPLTITVWYYIIT